MPELLFCTYAAHFSRIAAAPDIAELSCLRLPAARFLAWAKAQRSTDGARNMRGIPIPRNPRPGLRSARRAHAPLRVLYCRRSQALRPSRPGSRVRSLMFA